MSLIINSISTGIGCSSSSSSLLPHPPFLLLSLHLHHHHHLHYSRRIPLCAHNANCSSSGSSCCSTSFHSSFPLSPRLQFSKRVRRLNQLLSNAPASRRNSDSDVNYSSSSSDDYDREESRWFREEQRWLREEQRWLREEARWNSERQSLLQQISQLSFRVQELSQRLNSSSSSSSSPSVPLLSETTILSKIASILEEVPKAESPKEYGSGISSSNQISHAPEEISDEQMIDEASSSKMPLGDQQQQQRNHMDFNKTKPLTLRIGSEGQNVQAMQEALQQLGFYSGEEDIEFSSFSDGTLRAVKTWQASIGVPEDGIMTAELLERLYDDRHIENSGPLTNLKSGGTGSSFLKEEGANGALAASGTGITEVQQTVVNKGIDKEVDISKHRVFLLGENRWEDPSRLTSSGKQSGRVKAEVSPANCLACRGERRLMCTECDGSGEPNVEPQFYEWVDEGARCPYCEGLGYTVCDLCEGAANA